MELPVPQYTDEDLKRVVTRDFPHELRVEVNAVLDSYVSESCYDSTLRIRMACLKLADGNVSNLKIQVKSACDDFRDVLAAAEYPRYRWNSRPEEKAQASELDWAELQQWIHRPVAPTRASNTEPDLQIPK